jgi:16S rRNA (guanine(527)-N(7))-methyltransferase RsmG
VFADLLRQCLAGVLDVELSPGQIELLQGHYELLLRWNRSLNLTRIEGIEEAVERHYAESLFLGAHLGAHLPASERTQPQRIADIGSGAGFPGFPVAVLRPDCRVALIESHQRKAVFLREASRALPNVEVIAKRAEDVGFGFDLVISRAVSYEDLRKPLRLAPWAYLLTGSEEPTERTGKIGFVQSQVLPLPWGKQRFLRIGRVE